jgi:SAM-dependent methyltransferase
MRETTTNDFYERRLGEEAYLDGRREKARVVAHLCADDLRRATAIADLGTGTGIIKRELQEEFGKYIVGFELSTSMMRESEGMVRADILRLPAADAAFDFVMLNHVYEHVSRPERLFEEAFRILKPGGRAYVTAGTRFALIEPHYRLPLLSWMPPGAADAYLRLTRRGLRYGGIRFLTYRRLVSIMAAPGFRVRDITRRAIDELVEASWGSAWARLWRSVRALPAGMTDRALRLASPQWFFLLERSA